MNNRRKLLMALGAGVFVAPFTSFAQQQGRVWRVGFLATRARSGSLESDLYGGFPLAMRKLGYIENKNLTIDWRFAEGEYERLAGLAAELVDLKVDVIVTAGTPATRAAQKATAIVPIVMTFVGDPVVSGFVNSLARPGGNITGLSIIAGDLGPKLLEMMLRTVPNLSRAAVLLNPANASTTPFVNNVGAAAEQTNIKILLVEVRTAQEIVNAFSVMARERVGAVILARDVLFTRQHRQIAELAVRLRLPSISGHPAYAEAGGLIAYGSSSTDDMRRAAVFVDKIFKGTKPADLPVEQPTSFELHLNLKTAKALGITLPQSILVRADRIIE